MMSRRTPSPWTTRRRCLTCSGTSERSSVLSRSRGTAGPYVQMAANNLPFTDLDANGNPKLADMYQSLGILPFGATPSNMDAFLPNWFRKAEAGDTMSGQYQQNLWYIMQAENYKYKEGLRKTAPTWPEISDRATKQSWMKVLFAASLPLSLSAK